MEEHKYLPNFSNRWTKLLAEKFKWRNINTCRQLCKSLISDPMPNLVPKRCRISQPCVPKNVPNMMPKKIIQRMCQIKEKIVPREFRQQIRHPGTSIKMNTWNPHVGEGKGRGEGWMGKGGRQWGWAGWWWGRGGRGWEGMDFKGMGRGMGRAKRMAGGGAGESQRGQLHYTKHNSNTVFTIQIHHSPFINSIYMCWLISFKFWWYLLMFANNCNCLPILIQFLLVSVNIFDFWQYCVIFAHIC